MRPSESSLNIKEKQQRFLLCFVFRKSFKSQFIELLCYRPHSFCWGRVLTFVPYNVGVKPQPPDAVGSIFPLFSHRQFAARNMSSPFYAERLNRTKGTAQGLSSLTGRRRRINQRLKVEYIKEEQIDIVKSSVNECSEHSAPCKMPWSSAEMILTLKLSLGQKTRQGLCVTYISLILCNFSRAQDICQISPGD